MFIDTHAHLNAEEFNPDRDEVVLKARQAGIGRIYIPNVDAHSIDSLVALHQSDPALIYPLMGLHPCSVKEDYLIQLNRIETALNNGQYLGIGEMGIDLHWDPSTLPNQKEAFKIQCQWACELDLPIIIHSREALDAVIELLENMDPRPARGIFHCFSGNQAQVEKIGLLGDYYFGLGGVITFKNSGLADLVFDLPMDKIVLETDAPYLAPVPYRGKRNEPSYLIKVASKLAEIKNMTLETIENQTTINALNVYKDPDQTAGL